MCMVSSIQPTPATDESPTAVPTPTAPAESDTLFDLAGLNAGPGRGFVVLDNPAFIPAPQSALGSDEIVLSLEWDGEQRAYPVSMMAYHHIANDNVRGSPILVTY